MPHMLQLFLFGIFHPMFLMNCWKRPLASLVPLRGLLSLWMTVDDLQGKALLNLLQSQQQEKHLKDAVKVFSY